MCSSVFPVRRRFYEIFLKLHYCLSLLALALIWIHLPHVKGVPILFAAITSLLWTLHTIWWLLCFIRRNPPFRRRYNCSLVTFRSIANRTNTTKITIKVERLKVLPGQFIYINSSTLNPHDYSTWLQYHPYMIAWTDPDQQDATSNVINGEIVIFVEAQRGFSQSLVTSNDTTRHLALDGPYGDTPSLLRYDIIMFQACGIGLAAHLLLIRSTLQRYLRMETRTRRIFVVWVLEDEGNVERNSCAYLAYRIYSGQEQWFIDYIKDLLDTNTDPYGILATMIYYANPNDHEGESRFRQRTLSKIEEERQRIYRINESYLDHATPLIRKAWISEAGNMVVAGT